MSFFDEAPMSLPDDGQYYFNIMVVDIAVDYEANKQFQILPDGVTDMWFIDNINEPRPYATHLYIVPRLREDWIFEMIYYPHCVIEVSDQLGVSWWHMLDFETDDPWRIDLDEDFD